MIDQPNKCNHNSESALFSSVLLKHLKSSSPASDDRREFEVAVTMQFFFIASDMLSAVSDSLRRSALLPL